MRIRRLLPLMLALLCWTSAVQAASADFASSSPDTPLLAPPEGPVLLTVSGDISRTNGDGVARFDRAMLEALPGRTIETHTPWHEDVGRYRGPLGEAILEAVDAHGDQARVVALNGFEAEVPVSDFRRYGVILAMKRNGKAMPIRRFGPLFVLYPFDERPELLNETIRFRSVWQVSRIEIH
ncbi:oxidoreductase [Halomonas getboli]|uniref:oxidoreductase n=1 Tax=Halomonas getboli TaxID=2935862 RepID=UPI001FFED576|nr:oxidoreductase [Halomonas getboli]MCK2184562.1 oxidoreductase [Halomonas getboli]